MALVPAAAAAALVPAAAAAALVPATDTVIRVKARPVTDGSSTAAAPGVPRELVAAQPPERQPDGTFIVRAQHALAAFMYCSGPCSVTEYNWNQVYIRMAQTLVKRHMTAEKADPFMDTLHLTPTGATTRASRNVFTRELACTGRSEYGEPDPNCFSECGVIGACVKGCPGGVHHKCTARLTIKASVDDVRKGQFRVATRNKHVPTGVIPMPPPPRGRRVAAHVKAEMAKQCLGGSLPVQVVNSASAALGAHPQTSSRFVPPAAVASRAVKLERRTDRGTAPTDELRVDQIVRERLIQRQCVLLYEPGGILVLTSPAALEAAFESGRRDVASDAKVDVVTGMKVKWSTIRGRSVRGGRWVPFIIWISEHENTETVTAAARALRNAVRCSDPACMHDWQCTFSSSGSFKMERTCAIKSYAPRHVCVDKHMPSIAGFRAVFGTISLCTFHVFRCVDDKLKKLGIKGWKAQQLMWAFRLIKRARSHAHADEIFKEVVVFILGGTITQPEPLCTFDEASKFIDYLRRCWMYPQYMRMAWIDASGIGVEGHITTTGAQEGAHAYLEKFITGGTVQQLVSQAVTATVGMTAGGRNVPSVFGDAVQRCAEAGGVEECPAAKLRRAKAQLQFLRLSTGAAKPAVAAPGECTAVASCDDGCLVTHAEAWGERRGGRAPRASRPAGLDAAVAAVAHGGTATGTCGDGWHSVCNSTGRCECEDSLYRGILSAEGPCKHELVRRLCARAAAEPEQVEQECFVRLQSFVRKREGSKPPLLRCVELYEAAAAGTGTVAGLLSALAQHQSVPPTGKGCPSAAAVGQQPAGAGDAGAGSDDDVPLDMLLSSRVQEHMCTFNAGPLGAVLRARAWGGLAVVAFTALPCGMHGPAVHSGSALHCGDTVTHVGSLPATAATLGGNLAVPVVPVGGAELRFTRQRAPAVAVPSGPRAKVQPKFGGGGGGTKRKRDNTSGSLGGSVARARLKGAGRSRAVDLPAAATPTATETSTISAIASMVSVSPGGAARAVNQAVLAAAQARFMEAMDPKELAAREAEMAGKTYLD